MISNTTLLCKNLDSAIRIFLCIVLFWIPYSPAAIEIGVIISLLLCLIKRSVVASQKIDKSLSLKNKIRATLLHLKPETSPINKPIFFFVIVCFVSSLHGVTPLYSLRGLITKTLEWFVVFFLVIEVFKTKRQIYWALGILIFTSLAVFVDGYVQYYLTGKDFFLDRQITILSRASASFRTPNGLGAYLIVIVPLSLSLIGLKLRKSVYKIIFYLFFAVFFWLLVITFSRGAWLGLYVGMFLFSSYIGFLKKNKFVAVLTICIVYFALILSGWVLYDEFNKHTQTELRSNTAEWRISVWKDCMRMIKERPVLGYGINTFMREFQKYYKESHWFNEYSPTYAHNCYIQILAETGVLGLSMFLWMLFSLFRNIHKKIIYFYLKDKNLMILLIGLFSGILSFLVQSFFDTNFYSLQLSIYMWFMIGILVSIFKVYDYQDLNISNIK